MTFHHLESADDPRVSDYTQLTDVHLRKIREPAEGLYIAESSRVLRRALAAGHRPRSFFLAEKWARGPGGRLRAVPGRPRLYRLRRRCSRKSPASTCTAAPWPPCTGPAGAAAELLAGARRVAVLEDIVDHTNVGAIFRSAAALGVDAVLVSPRCGGSALPPQRAGQHGHGVPGAVGAAGGLAGGPGSAAGAGFTVAAMELTEDAVDLDELAARRPDGSPWCWAPKVPA